MRTSFIVASAMSLVMAGCGTSNDGASSSSESQSQASSSSSSSQVISSSSSSSAPAVVLPKTGKQMEMLDRGLVAVSANGGIFLSWRLFGTDPADVSFNLYRNGQLIHSSPATAATNYTDTGGNASASYEVRAVINGSETAAGKSVGVWGQQYRTVDLNRPSGGTSPDGVAFEYSPNDASVADVDGDGEYEIILKWDPSNAHDNAHDGYTGNVYIDAYRLNGEQLWRIDLGRNVRAGAHYTQFLAYDFDGDGKAEVAFKTADGTIDGVGQVIGNANADYRNGSGRVLSGPEFLTVFNGQTGAAMQTINYPNARGAVSDWGDNYGNRVDRFLAGVAYVDGKRPSMIFSRGYYEKAMISAIDWREGQLNVRWTFVADGSQNSQYRGQGAHSLSVADVDQDGRDEIVFGAATIDDNGRGLYSTGLCHGDALHVTDIDPNREGLEVFMVHESPSCYGSWGVEVHDARTGEVLYGNDGSGVDVGRGLAADVTAGFPGVEVFGSRGGTMTTTHQQLNYTPGSNFAIWWDGDLLRELLNDNYIDKWNSSSNRNDRVLSGGNYGAASNNGTKATPSLSADILGDWREEVIWRNSNNRQLMIFTTTIPTQHRLYTLMHDPQYRVAIAWQNTAYNQPPHPGFFLGADMSPAPVPDIHYADGVPETPADIVRIQENHEGFCGVDGVLESSNAGYTGTGYANTDNAAGTTTRWQVAAPQAGSVHVTVRFAGTSNRPAQLRVNGVDAANVSFNSTDAWTLWNTESVQVNLQAGNNTIELVAQSADGLPNIDFIEFPGTQYTGAACQ